MPIGIDDSESTTISCTRKSIRPQKTVKQTMKRASAFISSNFSEYELINKASSITPKEISASLDVLFCRS